MDPRLYYPLFINIILILTIAYALSHRRNNVSYVLAHKNNIAPTLLLCLIITLVLGLRPIHHLFGDTINYARIYERFQYGITTVGDNEGEWVWDWIMYQCSQVMDVSLFFLIIEIGYIGCTFWACKRLMPNNMWVAVLMNMASFSFYSYGINGIRNGLACAIMLVAFSYILGSKKDKLIAALLCFCAYNIHHSAALPILMMVVSAFVVRDTRLTLAFWVLSIFLSLTIGGAIENFFAGLGFDDRLSGYISDSELDDQFSSTGFRFDFLLYSMMPIILGWYIVIKRGIADKNYLLLLNTYILCNAFWIMVIRASFSNRFAYLSWFIYPMILAYPLLRLPIWNDQSKKLNWIMLANVGFTYLMWLIS